MESFSHTSANGLTTIICPQPGSGVVSIQLWVETGSIHEGARLGAGLSHLLEHFVFKGTEEYSAAALNERVSSLGGAWNAYTSTDRTVFYIDGPAKHSRELIHLLVQLAFHPTFPRDEFERERDVIRKEMAMYRDDPQDVAYSALMGTLYKAHPRRLPVIGYQDSFDSLSYEDMVAYHRERYVPNNAFFCIAGDVSPEDILHGVEQEMENLRPAPLPIAPLPVESRQWGSRLCRREFAQSTSTLMLAWRIPSSNHPDAAPLSLLSSILGDGRTAWLYKRFHDDTGLAHDISTFLIPAAEGEGALVVEADVERNHRDALRQQLVAYMEALKNQDMTIALTRARKQLLTSRLRQCATAQGLASLAGMSWHLSRNTESMEEWAAALNQVAPEDLRQAALHYLAPDRLVEVSIDPLGSNIPTANQKERPTLESPQITILPNGLRLVTRVDRRLPMAYANLSIGAGCQTETENTAGINSLLAECLLKGTATRDAATIASALENLGGTLSSSTGNNTLMLAAQCLAEDVPSMVELLADVALHPTFPAEAVAREQEAMLADIQENEEDPVALAFRRVRPACFGRNSYGNHPDGTESSVRNLTPAALHHQHAQLMCGHNAVLAITGDIRPETILQLVEKHFAAMPSGVPAYRTPTPPQQAGNITATSPREQAVLLLAIPGASISSPKLLMQLLLEEWCRDMAGPIYNTIREQHGLAYYAASASLVGTDAGCLYFYLGTAPEQLEQARQLLSRELQLLAVEGMPEQALEQARATVLTGRLMAYQSGKKICANLALHTLQDLGVDYDDTFPARLQSITISDMKQYMAELFAPERPHTWVTILPKGPGSK